MKRAGKAFDVKSLEALKPREKPYRQSEGNGLLLEIRPSGAKIWLCRLTVDGKRRDMGLGSFPTVTLAKAREAALAARREAADGIDPIIQRAAKQKERVAARNSESEAAERTFRSIADMYILAYASGWKNARTAAMWLTSLQDHAFPVLGDMPVAKIDRAAVLRAITAVWTSRPATARKVVQRIGTILRYAAPRRSSSAAWRAEKTVSSLGESASVLQSTRHQGRFRAARTSPLHPDRGAEQRSTRRKVVRSFI